MGSVLDRVESALEHALPRPDVDPARLHDGMRYAVLGGGKRVRPLLTFAAGDIAGALPERLELAACAVECIHAYSLVHDDMPCMDDDVLRRGKPTVHVEFDEATALLVGDALQTLAFQMLAVASGSRGMAGGQAIDLANVGVMSISLPELEMMHIHKTGALIRAAVALGARCAGGLSPADLERLDGYAKCVGLAFQVVDDILDAEGTTASLGKTAGKDAAQNKPTYVTLMGADRAKELAAQLRAEAHAAIAPFGARGLRLAQLADFIVLRKF